MEKDFIKEGAKLYWSDPTHGTASVVTVYKAELPLEEDSVVFVGNGRTTIGVYPSELTRTLRDIAKEIRSDWKKVYFGAVPYLDAMETLDGMQDNYYLDSAASVVRYFLANAGTWRGETARRIKKELNSML